AKVRKAESRTKFIWFCRGEVSTASAKVRKAESRTKFIWFCRGGVSAVPPPIAETLDGGRAGGVRKNTYLQGLFPQDGCTIFAKRIYG
ncbi:hypothetical protein, partial [Alistipes communis]|uniref:hypothetical protein n=1 Tax=Alistipes communis TaxID=2585118 RepID=UPI0026DA7963